MEKGHPILKKRYYFFCLLPMLPSALSFHTGVAKTANQEIMYAREEINAGNEIHDTFFYISFDKWLSELIDTSKQPAQGWYLGQPHVHKLTDSIRILAETRANTGDTTSMIPFRASNKWHLVCYQQSGSEYYYQKKPPRNMDRCYVSTMQDTAVSSKDIFDAFHLPDSLRSPFRYFPLIHARNAPLNAVWTAIMLNPYYLIIRRVHSYPDGNATSWYIEQRYYFRKATAGQYRHK